ncbi:MAG: geranylgeranyl reductase family protein [Oscillospiraceae bacterium]|nr:geranylgeranyl reductase family protein [Oscillospiraceae bacterium]
MFEKRQVIVVGAGPGGSTTAFYLAKYGVDVLLVDKETWPRDKPCGDAQGNSIFPIYKDMGIYEEAERLASGRIRGSKFSGVNEEITTFDSGISGGFVTQRRVIDDLIRRGAINGGADWLENFEVTEVIRERNYAKGVRGFYGGKTIEIRADAVVLADGGHSILGRPFGLFLEDPDLIFIGARGYFDNVKGLVQDFVEEHYPAEIFYPGGYMWLFPMGGEKANVGVYISEKNLQRGNRRLEDYFTWWRDNTKIGKERLGEARLLGEIKGWRLPTCREVGDNFNNAILAVGDAGNHINCYSGGGLDYAMKSGVAAAETLVEALKSNDLSKEALSVYKDKRSVTMDALYRLNSAVRDKLCCDPETYERFLAFSRQMPNYPNNNQYAAYIGFLTQVQKVDLMGEYKLDLRAMVGADSSGGSH